MRGLDGLFGLLHFGTPLRDAGGLDLPVAARLSRHCSFVGRNHHDYPSGKEDHYQLVVRCMSLVRAVPAVVSSILQVHDQDRGEHGESTKVFAAVGNMSKSGANQAARAVIRGPKTDKPGGSTPDAPKQAPSGAGGADAKTKD